MTELELIRPASWGDHPPAPPRTTMPRTKPTDGDLFRFRLAVAITAGGLTWATIAGYVPSWVWAVAGLWLLAGVLFAVAWASVRARARDRELRASIADNLRRATQPDGLTRYVPEADVDRLLAELRRHPELEGAVAELERTEVQRRAAWARVEEELRRRPPR